MEIKKIQSTITKIDKIFHVSDIHIRTLKRHTEYREVFQNMFNYINNHSTENSIAVVTGDIVLVKNQSTSANNGIYTVASGSWTRNSSLDNTLDYSSNFVVYVQEGYANNQTLWIGVTSSTGFTLGSTALYFDDAFKQCVVVNTGNGIISKYRAKTEKPFFFRYTVTNTYYVWAEPGLSTLSSGF